MDRIIYPFIRKRLHLAFTPITRITLGFLVAALAMLYAGTLQSAIYAAPPCFKYPNACKMGQTDTGKSMPNQVHIGWQAPAYVLVAVSEILASVTGLELAYAKAPENMKSFIMSLFLLTSAGGSLLGILIAPLAKDPFLQWLYFGLAIVAMGTGVAFHWTFAGVGGADGGSGVGLKQEDEIELMARGSEDDGYYSGEEERGGRT
jgi:dipeptide/tripeptide permease